MLGRRFQDEASPSPLRCGPGGAPEDPAPLLPSLLPNQNHRTNCPERSAAVRQRQMLSSPRSSSGHLGRGYPLAPLILDSPEGSSRLQSVGCGREGRRGLRSLAPQNRPHPSAHFSPTYSGRLPDSLHLHFLFLSSCMDQNRKM